MKTIKLYLIKTTEAYTMAEQGAVYASIDEPQDSSYYKHEVLTEAEITLPEPLEVVKQNGGEEIAFGNRICDLYTKKDGDVFKTFAISSECSMLLHVWD